MSALAPVLAVSVLSVCLFHALPGAAAENLPRSDCGTKPADIVFLLDSSISVEETNFDKVKEFVKQFVKSVEIGPTGFNVGVVTFETYVHNIFWLDTYTTKNSLLEAIDKIPYISGGTSTERGLEFVREEAFTKAHGDREDANNILVVVTDGKSYDATLTADQANKIHKTDIKVIAVGVGHTDETELKTIASDEESVFEVINFDALKSIEQGLTITACEAAVAPDDECGILSGDIVFLLDSSGSVGSGDFEKVKAFVKHMATSFMIGPDEVRMGVITFDTEIHDEFWLKEYTSESLLLQAIDSIPCHDGLTNTDMALSYARQYAFSTEHGGRDDAADILIVITDGPSTYPESTHEEAEELHKTDVTVHVIGVGEFMDKSELEIIANGKENVFDITDFSAFDTVKNTLTKTACRAIAFAPFGSRRAVAAARPYAFRDNEE